ncbi:MAG: hypothetical protein E6G57_08280 [Actinobacteria bacterium]|nr:MAG: hypothetical protein E6G57_08280 [Actinomycetota bacterium]
MPARGERVAPPPKAGGWDFRYADKSAAEGWEKLARQAPGPTRSAYDAIVADPRQRSGRQFPLKGDLGKRTVKGKQLDQWEYEVTGGGRVFYCIDDDERVAWMTLASPGHPKATD